MSNNDLETNEVQTHLKEDGNSTTQAKKATASGLEENIAGLLCYVFHFITGIIFLFIEKDNRFVRFHAMQSIFTFVPLFFIIMFVSFVLAFIPFIGWLLSMLLWFASIGLWVFLMYKAYQGEYYKLPIVGDLAEKQLK